MRKIFQLAPQIVSQIAAGEVIERPVYAIKELVENAIDAGADTINIVVEESGLKKIIVADNGEGMNAEDVQESFKPHTTSKIRKSEELSQIHTLGFRGEALASIAAISRLTISSRTSESAIGTSVVIKNGKLEKIVPIGMASGTSVTVDYLFHSLPARKKFFKSPRSEFRHILEVIIGYALSYPQIHFTLQHNKKTVLHLPKVTDPLVRIEKLFGDDFLSALVPVSFQNAYITISGFLAKPTQTSRTPTKQFLFINNRVVSDKKIAASVKSAYGSLLAGNVYPIFLLYFKVPFEMVDVNVHPRKEYVRFVDTTLLAETIQLATAQSFSRYDLTTSVGPETLFLKDAVGSTDSYAGQLLKEKKLPWERTFSLKSDEAVIVQLHNVYLLVAAKNGFILVDQHAAHERILYELLCDEFLTEKRKHTVFHFPKPGIFQLSVSESLLLHDFLPYFEKMGWEMEQFKDTSFIIHSLPVLFQDRDYVLLLREILDDLKNNAPVANIDEVSRKMIAYLACRGAVKKGDRLLKKQAKNIIDQLDITKNNTSCPHGRPTKVTVDLDTIDKLFKR